MALSYQKLFSSSDDFFLKKYLKRLKYQDPEKSCHNCHEILKDVFSRDEAFLVLPILLREMAIDADPDACLNNFERFCRSIFSKTTFFKLIYRNKEVRFWLIRLFSTSQFLTDVLIRNPEYLDWVVDEKLINFQSSYESLMNELNKIQSLFSTEAAQNDALRRFHRRELLKIGVKDLAQKNDFIETVYQISLLADVLIDQAYQLSYRNLSLRYGTPMDENNEPVSFMVLGMGKLGGMELNYSSDIDLMFVYRDEGMTTGIQKNSRIEGKIENHLFFSKLAESIIGRLNDHTREGYVYRVDMRLRPEGDTGPLVRSLSSYYIYYESWGQNWERQALIKARCVAGDKMLFLDFKKMMQSFIFNKTWDKSDFANLYRLRKQTTSITKEKGAFKRDVKSGYGSIREIEFGVQLLQLLFARQYPELKSANTLNLLDRLASHGLLDQNLKDILKNAYIFLRTVEHILQIQEGRQIREVPKNPQHLMRLAIQMQFRPRKNAIDQFLKQLKYFQKQVHDFYHGLFSELLGESMEEDNIFQVLIEKDGDLSDIKHFLEEKNFSDIPKALNLLILMANGPDYINISPDSKQMFIDLCPILLEKAASVPAPEIALENFEKFVSIFHGRKFLFESLKNNEKLISFLCQIFGGNFYLNQILMEYPSFLNQLSQSDVLAETKDDIIQDLKSIEIGDDFKVAKKKAEFFLGVFHLHRWISPTVYTHYLSEIADITITKVFQWVCKSNQLLPQQQIAIYSLGKLGGKEMGLYSDLDIVFVIDGEWQNVDLSHKVAHQIIKYLKSEYNYEVDARLRPGGADEFIVQHVQRYKKLVEKKYEIWQAMAFSRLRKICSFPENAQILSQISFVKDKVDMDDLVFINDLRKKINKHRVKGTGFNFKSEFGGLIDIEFLVQWLLVKNKLTEYSTFVAIELLWKEKIIQTKTKENLLAAYHFYRWLEYTWRSWRLSSNNQVDPLNVCFSYIAKQASQQCQDDLMQLYLKHRSIVRDIVQEFGFSSYE